VASQRRADRILIALLVLACGLAAWVKFTAFLLVLGLVATLLAHDVFRRRPPYAAGGLLLSLITFWLLAGQSMAVLPSYLRGGLSLSGSYSNAMATSGENWVWIVSGLFCLSSIAVLLVFLFEARDWRNAPAFAWATLYVFLGFKQAFVRQDDFHFWFGMLGAIFPGTLVVLAATGCIEPSSNSKARSGLSLSITHASTSTALVLGGVFLIFALDRPAGRTRVRQFASNAAAVFLQPTPSLRSATAAVERQIMRQADPIGPVHGAADFFPDNIAVLAANGIPMRLRPEPQAYSAYNEFLTRTNASWLRSSNRPDSVVFDIAPIDERYPTVSDSLSVLALLSCYEPAGFTGRYLLLSAAGCVATTRTPLIDTTVEAGKEVILPQRGVGPMWAEIETRRSVLEVLSSAMLRLPPLQLTIDTESRHGVFRIPDELANIGFLLSPLISDPVSFALLYAGQTDATSEIRALAVSREKSVVRLWGSRPIHVRLYSLGLPKRAEVNIVPPLMLQLARTVRSQVKLGNSAASPTWYISAGEPRLRVTASSAARVDVSSFARTLHVRWGLQNVCDQQMDQFSRVRFSLTSYSNGDTEPVTLLRRTLEVRGSNAAADEATLTLARDTGQIRFETEPVGGTCLGGAWWSGVRAEPSAAHNEERVP
jgi:hypothetical protein